MPVLNSQSFLTSGLRPGTRNFVAGGKCNRGLRSIFLPNRLGILCAAPKNVCLEGQSVKQLPVVQYCRRSENLVGKESGSDGMKSQKSFPVAYSPTFLSIELSIFPFEDKPSG